MARSVFKRAVKMGIKDVRKSIAGLAMESPCGKVDFNFSRYDPSWGSGRVNSTASRQVGPKGGRRCSTLA
jgi:hypothetical protein